MPSQLDTHNKISTVDGKRLIARWPRIWTMVIGIILIFLSFCIVGMEIGNTVLELRRATAFGGFILFLPLLGYAIFILFIGFQPRLIFRRIAMILSFIIIVLCLLLIAYDIVIVIDPTRCLFFNCNDATINISNSTTNAVTSGYPVYVAWPSYFQTNMNAKRVFQSIQMFCAGLFILFTGLFLLTYFVYQTVNSHQKRISNVGGRPSSSTEYHASPRVAVVHTKARRTTSDRPQINSPDVDRICTRCLQEPRIAFTADRGRKNYYSHLCASCNDEVLNSQHKSSSNGPTNDRARKY